MYKFILFLHICHLHDMTSHIGLSFWRMKIFADTTIPVHELMAEFEM
jgi:hypothetical protein